MIRCVCEDLFGRSSVRKSILLDSGGIGVTSADWEPHPSKTLEFIKHIIFLKIIKMASLSSSGRKITGLIFDPTKTDETVLMEWIEPRMEEIEELWTYTGTIDDEL